jgi:hypothetical protein
MRFKLRRHAFTLGHICKGANVDILDENGNIVGYLTPEFADRLPSIEQPTFPLSRQWKIGERVEAVGGGYGGSPVKTRPGTVHAIEPRLVVRERLVIAFDDGHTTPINPDVMRHIKE